MIVGSLFDQKQKANQTSTSSGVIKPLISTSSPVLQKQVSQPEVTVSKTNKVSEKTNNFIASLKLDQVSIKKIGKSFVEGAKMLPSQLKQGAGVMIQGVVSQQRALDNFYQKIPKIVKPLVAFNPLFSASATKDISPQYAKDASKKAEIKTEEFGAKIREQGFQESKKKKEEYAKTYEPSEGLQKYLEMVSFNLPQVATSVALTTGTALLTKNPALATTVGLSTSYGMGASEVYDEARSNGLSDKDSLPLAQFGGVVIGALDFIPLERLLRKTGASKVVEKSIIKKISKGLVSLGVQSGFEGITEGAQEVVGNAISSTYNENQDLFEGVKESVIVGALLGGMSDLTIEAVTGITGKSGENIQTKISEAISTPKEDRTDEQEKIVETLFTQEMTSDQLINYVTESGLQDTEEGKTLVKTAYQAQQSNQNVKISLSEDEKSLDAELVSKDYVAPIKEDAITETPIAEDKKGEVVTPEPERFDTVDSLIEKGYSPSEAEFIFRKRSEMQDVRSPGEKIDTSQYTRLEGEEPVTVYRVSEKGAESIGEGKFVFLSEKDAIDFRDKFGFQRGQPDIVKMEIKKSNLLKPKGEGFGEEYVYSTKVADEKTVVETPKVLKELSKKKIENAKTIRDVTRLVKKIRSEFDQLITEAEGKAEVAKELREGLNTKKIADLKRIYKRTRSFQEGDIETIRASKHQKLLDSVLENVQEKYPYKSEQEAFDFAIELPTKAEEKVVKPEEMKILKEKEKKLSLYLKTLQQKQESLNLKENEALNEEWRMVLNSQEKLQKIIEVPRRVLPQGEGKKKLSRLEARVNKFVDKVTEEQIERLGLASYNQLSKKENIEKAVAYVSSNPEEALQVLAGQKEAPEGILNNAIYIAMEQLAQGDLNLARRLASLSSTRMGQEISILTEVDPDSTVQLMRDIISVREEVFKQRFKGKTATEAKAKVVDEIQAQIKKPDKVQWNAFLNEIKC